MKKNLALITALASLLVLSSCSAESFSDMVSGIYDLLPQGEEIVEVKYEYFSIQDPQFSGCYKSLNSRQKDFYGKIYTISEEMTEGFVNVGDSYDNAVNDFSVAYNAFLNDNADVFWMPGAYILAHSGNDNDRKLAVAFSYQGQGKNNDYTVSKAERDEYKSKLDSVVKKVLSEIKGKSEYEKVLYINDFICDNVVYKEKGRLVNTSYGALVKKEALCEGYSRAFKLLCNNLL